MDVFDLLNRLCWNAYRQIDQLRQASTTRARECNGGRSCLLRLPGRSQDIRRVAACTDQDHQVVRPYQGRELLGKNAFVAAIIGPRGKQRNIIIERDDAVSGQPLHACSLSQVAGKVRGGRGAATIAQDKDSTATPVTIEQQLSYASQVL